MDQKHNLIAPNESVLIWTRRTMLGAVASLFWAGSPLHTLRAQSIPTDADLSTGAVQFEWEMPRRHAGRAAEYLGVSPDHIRPSPNADAGRGGPILVIIIAAVLLITLARSIVAVYRDIRYGGLIIQDTDRGLLIRHDRRIPGHVVIIRDRNGVTIRELRGGEVNVRDLVPILSNTRAVSAR